VHPHAFRTVLGRDPRILEYQVRQTATGAAVSIRIQSACATEAIAKSIAAELSHAGLPAPEISVAVVDDFPRRGSGKLKRFVPL
jgi:hypothetical protein